MMRDSKHGCANVRGWGPRLVLVAALLLSFSGSNVIAQTPQPLVLNKIEVVGLKRLTTEQVITTSGLQIGQAVSPDILDEAASKLMQSGFFKKLSYRLRAADNLATVVFEIDEATKNLPVVLENFVWFSDDEIVRGIRQDVPFFDGTSPETGTTADKIAASLRRLLKAKNIAGVVEFLPYADLNTGKQELLFTVKGVKIPVCSVQFPGAAVVSEAELIKTAQPLLSMDYSRKDASVFTQLNLFPLYRHLGYLRADFKQPTAIIDENAAARCAGGVAVTIPVEEGAAYSWAEAAWSGNQTLTNDELSAALGMKVGETADGLKIDKGMKAVKQAYGRKGYLAAQINESTEFEAQRVTYQFAVREGPQYHMGTLSVIGLSNDDAAELKKNWALASGDVFDGSYTEEFLKTSVREFLTRLVQRTRGSSPKRVGSELKLDRQNRAVDVVITFK